MNLQPLARACRCALRLTHIESHILLVGPQRQCCRDHSISCTAYHTFRSVSHEAPPACISSNSALVPSAAVCYIQKRMQIYRSWVCWPAEADTAVLGSDDSQQAVAFRLVVMGRTQRMR